jgi:hypothetical protein
MKISSDFDKAMNINLINCPACHQSGVSPEAAACPECGQLIKTEEARYLSTYLLMTIGLILLAYAIFAP